MHKAHVEEHAFHDAGKSDQAFQQGLVTFQRAGFELGVGQHVDKRNQEFIFVTNALNFVVRVEGFRFGNAQAFHNVLIRVGVNGFIKSLTQQKLAAFRRSNVAVRAQHNVVGSQ